MALKLTRKVHEVTVLNTRDGEIRVWWESMSDWGRVKMVIDAPASVNIVREELLDA